MGKLDNASKPQVRAFNLHNLSMAQACLDTASVVEMKEPFNLNDPYDGDGDGDGDSERRKDLIFAVVSAPSMRVTKLQGP